jgi:hypothetical protein
MLRLELADFSTDRPSSGLTAQAGYEGLLPRDTMSWWNHRFVLTTADH